MTDPPFNMGDRLTLRLAVPEARKLEAAMEATFVASEGGKWLLAEIVTSREVGMLYTPSDVYTIDPRFWVVEKVVAFEDRDDEFEGPHRPRGEEEAEG